MPAACIDAGSSRACLPASSSHDVCCSGGRASMSLLERPRGSSLLTVDRLSNNRNRSRSLQIVDCRHDLLQLYSLEFLQHSRVGQLV